MEIRCATARWSRILEEYGLHLDSEVNSLIQKEEWFLQ